MPTPSVERGGFRKADLEAVVGKIDVVGRIALPHRQDDVDGLGENLVAVLIEDADGFRIRAERAGRDAHDEAALREMIEHGRIDRDHDRMHLREIGRAGGELDPRGVVDQRGVEQHAVGDVLAGVGQMLADEGIVEAEFVGEDDRLAVLAQRLRPVPAHRVHRHGEVAQPHSFSPRCSRLAPESTRPGARMQQAMAGALLRGRNFTRGPVGLSTGWFRRLIAAASCVITAFESRPWEVCHAALVSRFDAEGGALLRAIRPPRRSRAGRRAGAARHVGRRRRGRATTASRSWNSSIGPTTSRAKS